MTLLSLFLGWDIHLFLSSNVRSLDSGTSISAPVILRPLTSDSNLHWLPWIMLDSDWIIPLAFLRLHLTNGRLWDFSASIILSEPIPIMNVHIYLYFYGSFWFFPGEPWLIQTFYVSSIRSCLLNILVKSSKTWYSVCSVSHWESYVKFLPFWLWICPFLLLVLSRFIMIFWNDVLGTWKFRTVMLSWWIFISIKCLYQYKMSFFFLTLEMLLLYSVLF